MKNVVALHPQNHVLYVVVAGKGNNTFPARVLCGMDEPA